MDHANPLDSSTNHSTLIKAIAWLSIVTSVFFVSIRTGMKWTNTKNLGLDDLTILLALAFCITGSVCLTLAASKGFANQDVVPDAETLLSIERMVFSFNLLFFFSLGSSMLSITGLIFQISPVQRHRQFAFGTAIGIGLWTIIAVFAFAFQCRPNGIDFLTSGQCIHRATLYTCLALLNLFLELSLVLQPTILTWNLNMALSRRITVITCFLGRLLVVIVLIAQMVIIWHRDRSLDILEDFGFVLTTILIMNTSIIAASTPYLRPFFISLNTAQMDMTELPRLKSNRGTAHGKDTNTGGSSLVRSIPNSPLYSSASRSKRSSRLWQSDAQDLGSQRSWKFERIDASAYDIKLRPDYTGKRSTVVTTNQISGNDQECTGTIERTIEFSLEVETIPKL